MTMVALLILLGNSGIASAEDTPREESDTASSSEVISDSETALEGAGETQMDVGTSEVESSDKSEKPLDAAEGVVHTAEEIRDAETPPKTARDGESVETTREKNAVSSSPVDITEHEAQSASVSEASPRAEDGPIPPQKISQSARRSYAIAVAEYHREYKKYRLMQVMGQSMLAASFAFEIIGTIMIEAASFGAVGWSGFALVGVGLVHFVSSAFLLGFSKPAHHLSPPPNIYERRFARQYSPEQLVIL